MVCEDTISVSHLRDKIALKRRCSALWGKFDIAVRRSMLFDYALLDGEAEEFGIVG